MTFSGQATTPEVRTLRRERAPGRPRHTRSRRRRTGSRAALRREWAASRTASATLVPRTRGSKSSIPVASSPATSASITTESSSSASRSWKPLTALVGRPSDGHPETDPGTDPRPARFPILPTAERCNQARAFVRYLGSDGSRRTERACRSRQGHISRKYRDALVPRHPGASAVRSNRSRSGREWRARRGIPDRRVSAGDGPAGRGGELPAGGRRLDEAAQLETGQAAQDGERRDAGSDGDAVG
jgi:hypothetical protein